MTDKQLPPDWALAQAYRTVSTSCIASEVFFCGKVERLARELSAQQPPKRVRHSCEVDMLSECPGCIAEIREETESAQQPVLDESGEIIRKLNYSLWMDDKGGCEPPKDWQEGFLAGRGEIQQPGAARGELTAPCHICNKRVPFSGGIQSRCPECGTALFRGGMQPARDGDSDWAVIRKQYVSLMAKIGSRFRPGYMGPVERAHITAAEWDLIGRYEDAAEHLSNEQARTIASLTQQSPQPADGVVGFIWEEREYPVEANRWVEKIGLKVPEYENHALWIRNVRKVSEAENPQPTDDGAVAWFDNDTVLGTFGVEARFGIGPATLPNGRTPLYLRPTRWVEVTEEAVRRIADDLQEYADGCGADYLKSLAHRIRSLVVTSTNIGSAR